MQKVTVYARFFGRVQGVGFRMLVVGAAKSAKLTGWARNSEHEDLVEVVFQGEREDVYFVIEQLKNKLGLARVDRVVVEEIKNSEFFSDFIVKY